VLYNYKAYLHGVGNCGTIGAGLQDLLCSTRSTMVLSLLNASVSKAPSSRLQPTRTENTLAYSIQSSYRLLPQFIFPKDSERLEYSTSRSDTAKHC